MERVNGIEPSSPGWKPGVITIIRHPLEVLQNERPDRILKSGVGEKALDL